MPAKRTPKKATGHRKYHMATEAAVSRNKGGKLVYSKKSQIAKKNAKKRDSWIFNVNLARKELKITGFMPCKKGTSFYKLAKKYHLAAQK